MAKQTKKGNRKPLTEAQKKARAAKAAETRARNKAKKEAEEKAKLEALEAQKVEETKAEETLEVEEEQKSTIEVEGDFTMEDVENADESEVTHVMKQEDLDMNPELKENGVEVGDVVTLGEEVEEESDEEAGEDSHIEDENLRRYIGNAVTNHAQRAVESGLLHMDEDALRTFVQESCNQCQYGDVERAMKFAVKCVNRVSSVLLMNNI